MTSREYRMMLGGKIVAATLLLAAAVALSGQQAQLWKLPRGWGFIVLLFPLIIGFLGAASSAVRQMYLRSCENR